MGPKDVFDTTLSVIEKYSAWRQMKKDTGAVLRLLYLESKRNSNLLSCINQDYNNKTKKQEFDFKELISALEIEILELIFMAGKSSSKVFEFMKDSADFELDDDFEAQESENPLNALSFLYVKIWTIKKLVSINQSTVLRKINYKVRLKNINSAYISLLVNLEKVPEIKPLIKK